MKRRSDMRRRRKELGGLDLYGYQLVQYLTQYTGDEHPFVHDPMSIYYDKRAHYAIIANQRKGTVTLLWK